VLKGHGADQRAVGQEGNVHGREGQQSMHHKGILRANLEQAGNIMLVLGSLSRAAATVLHGETHVGMYRVHKVKLLASCVIS
jgi:hypothetical protein